MTFFPLNEDTFLDNMMEEIKELSDIDDWSDVFHTRIDNETSNNSNEDNIMIINEYAGSIYDAIQLYQNIYGVFEIPDNKWKFYAQLAFISIYDKFYEVVDKLVEEL
jgi:hypothetical protein